MADATSGHRVPMLGGRGRYPDPGRSSDPAVRELVTALATLPSPAPRAHFRAELRAQLVAVAPRLVAEGREEAAAAEAPRRSAERVRPHVRIAAGVRIAVAALAACAVLLGGVVWLSRSALPGDALYGLKRASESAQLALASDSHQRAADLLAFAKTRADEVSELLSQPSASAAGTQAGTAISADKAALIRSTLGSADDDLRQASQLLGSQAVRERSGSPLTLLLQWAPGQQGRLSDIAGRIPAGDLRQAAQSSADLVAAAVARAKALQANVACSCLGGGGSDALGPRPCQPCNSGSLQPTTPTVTPGVPAPTSRHPNATSHAPAPGATTAPQTGPQQTSGNGGSTGSGGSSSGGGVIPPLPLPTTSLPTLPLPSISLPPLTSTGSCSPAVTIGPIKIGCGLSVGI